MYKNFGFMRILILLFFLTALEIFSESSRAETMQNCKRTEADTLVQVATQKYGKVEPKDALKIFQDVLIIRRDLKDIKGESITLNYIGSVYKELRDYPNAIIFYQKALEISKNLGDKDSDESILKNISEVNKLAKEESEAIRDIESSPTSPPSIRYNLVLPASRSTGGATR